MENIQQITTIISACVGLIAAVTGFLIPLVKNVKVKNSLKAANTLTSKLQTFIVEAEQFANFSGEEKKQYVITKANQFAIDNKLTFDASAVSDKIEELIQLTKNVNKRAEKSAAPQSRPFFGFADDKAEGVKNND